MKQLLLLSTLVALIIAGGCKKKEDPEPTTTTTTPPTPSSGCCAPFIATTGGSSNPDSVYMGNSWEHYYFTITDGTNSGIASTEGYGSYGNWGGNNPSDSCLYYKEFGNIIGFVSHSSPYFGDYNFSLYLPYYENDLTSLPTGKYGHESSYNAWFNTDKPHCIGSMHLQYDLTNDEYRSVPQASNATYYNEIQEIAFYGYDGADKIYSIKGVGKVLMQNGTDTSIYQVVDVTYRILAEY